MQRKHWDDVLCAVMVASVSVLRAATTVVRIEELSKRIGRHSNCWNWNLFDCCSVNGSRRAEIIFYLCAPRKERPGFVWDLLCDLRVQESFQDGHYSKVGASWLSQEYLNRTFGQVYIPSIEVIAGLGKKEKQPASVTLNATKGRAAQTHAFIIVTCFYLN